MTRRATIAVVGLAWGSLAILAAGSAAGLHANRTVSMPAGLWLEHPYTGAVRAGDAVAVCLPPTEQARRYIGPGSCPNGMEPLLKTVGAVPGDIVTLAPGGVAVNGKPLPGTAALAVDSADRPLTPYPAGTYQVRPGQSFLFSSHDPRSFDSRYFGPIETSAIIAVATPVWTTK